MDIQQILALALVAAAAVFILVRMVRRRRSGKFPECADCIQQNTHRPPGRPGKA